MRSRGRPPVEHADISERVTRGAGRGARGERASARTVYLKDHVLHADKLLAAGHLLELLGREREWARQHGGHLRQQTRSATGSARRAARGGHTSTSGFLGIKLVPTLDGSLCTGDSVVCTSWNDVIVLLRGGRSQSSRAQAFFSVEHIWSGQTVAVCADRFGLDRPLRSWRYGLDRLFSNTSDMYTVVD